MIQLAITALAVATLAVAAIRWSLRKGPAAAYATTIALIDVGARAILERTSLYVDATYAQPALRAQGVATGIGVALGWLFALALRLRDFDWPRWRVLDSLVAAIIPLALAGATVGLLRGNQLVYLVGDTYKLLVVPLVYFTVRWLSKGEHDYVWAFMALAAVSFGAAAVQTLEIAVELAAGDSLVGVGAPPLAALALILGIAAVRNEPKRAQAVVGALALCWLLVLNLLSLGRGIWLSTVAMVGLAALVAPRRVLAKAILPIAAMAASVGVLFLFGPAVLQRQLESRATDPLGSHAAVVTVLPPVDPISSVDQRIWEATDAFVDLTGAGARTLAIGKGSGAEYPTALNPTESTSAEGHRHHIHVTWASILYRHGAFGLTLVLALLGFATYQLVRAVRTSDSGTGDANVVRIALLLWLLGSVINLTNAYGLFGEVAWGLALASAAGLTERCRRSLGTRAVT